MDGMLGIHPRLVMGGSNPSMAFAGARKACRTISQFGLERNGTNRWSGVSGECWQSCL